MFQQKAEAGQAHKVSLGKWPKGAIVTKEVKKNEEGRFVAYLTVNGGTFSLPGTHPTEADANTTLVAYIEEMISE